MSTFERGPDSFGNFYQPPDIQEVYLHMLARHNALIEVTVADESTRKRQIKKWTEDTILTTKVGENGNTALLRIDGVDADNSGTVLFGYYSPLYDDFAYFPELVEPNEAEVINQEARRKRQEALEEFDREASAQTERVDYSHPAIQSLHLKHQRLLEEGDFFDKILKRHNYDSSTTPTNQIWMDEFTTMSVCLAPKMVVGGTRVGERVLAVRLMGSYHEINGEAKRDFIKVIPVAEQNPGFNGMDFKIIGDWVTEEELEYLKAIAVDLKFKQIDLEERGFSLDTEKLGIKTKPQRPKELT